MKALHTVTWILLIIGGLNWGLVGLGWNVVNMVLGSWPMVENLVYILVGLSALFEIFNHKNTCKECNKGMAKPMGGATM